MNLIGKDRLFDVPILSAQALQQIDRLLEINIPIVVSLDKQHRRSPVRNRRIRGRLKRQLKGVKQSGIDNRAVTPPEGNPPCNKSRLARAPAAAKLQRLVLHEKICSHSCPLCVAALLPEQ